MRKPRDSRDLWYSVTVGLSAKNLLRGQLSFFRNAGYNVTLAASDDPDAQACVASENVHFKALPMQRKSSPLADLVALGRWIATLHRERPAIVNYATPKAALLTSIAAAITGVPRRIYVVWGLRYEGLSGAGRTALIYVEKLICAISTDIVAVSDSVATEMIRAGITGKPIAVIGAGSSNGVDANSITSDLRDVDCKAVRERLDIGDELVVAFVGRINPDKGISTLIDAMEIVHTHRADVHLLIIGPEDDADIATKLGTASFNHTVTGWVDKPWLHLQAADIFCLPTLREGFPNVVLEAAVAGIATVTTTATGARDSVIDDETGLLVPPGDPLALADALVRLCDDRELRFNLARQAQERAVAEFTPERIWRGLLSLYERTGITDVHHLSRERHRPGPADSLRDGIIRS